MEKILLLRSYGDFVISLYHLTNTPPDYQPYRLVASKHLEQLHLALFPFLSPAQKQIEFVDFGIKNQILSGFTHRYLLTTTNLKELKSLQRQLQGVDSIVLEQKRRAWLIKLAIKAKVSTVHKTGNIYDSWANFYQNKTALQVTKSKHQSVLIFPDSRLQRKAIPENVLMEIENQFNQQGMQVHRAYFKKAVKGIAYQNFEALVQLVHEAKYIISSDSLPAHIAQLLQKPHTILYANQINLEWVTPFAKENGSAYLFEEVNKIKI